MQVIMPAILIYLKLMTVRTIQKVVKNEPFQLLSEFFVIFYHFT